MPFRARGTEGEGRRTQSLFRSWALQGLLGSLKKVYGGGKVGHLDGVLGEGEDRAANLGEPWEGGGISGRLSSVKAAERLGNNPPPHSSSCDPALCFLPPDRYPGRGSEAQGVMSDFRRGVVLYSEEVKMRKAVITVLLGLVVAG